MVDTTVYLTSGTDVWTPSFRPYVGTGKNIPSMTSMGLSSHLWLKKVFAKMDALETTLRALLK